MSEELISKAAAQNAEMAAWNLEAIRSRESGIQEIRENPEPDLGLDLGENIVLDKVPPVC